MKDNYQLRQARDRFVDLLDNPKSLERDWQQLFKQFPFILTDCLALGIAPHKLVPCKPGRAEADFYFFPETTSPLSAYGVIEIKRPNTRILRVPRKDVICLSAAATVAIAQAKKYATELKAEVEKVPSQTLILGNSFHIFIIAGLSIELAQKFNTEILSSQLATLMPPQCRLIPFDVLSRVLAAKVPPRLYVMVPKDVSGVVNKTIRTRTWHKGNWACAFCGTPITRLPFEPDPARLGFLSCSDCHRRQRVCGLRGVG